MQSRISFFNRTLFRKNLTRFWPLWAMPSFIGALFPLAMLVQFLNYGTDSLFGSANPLEMTSLYYTVAGYAVPIISLFYAALVAVAVWSYLFNARGVGLMHTLPARREGLFFTGFLSGMTMIAIPYAVTGLLCLLISLAFGLFDPVGLLVTVLAVIGQSLFYFGSATLVAFVTGNLFAMPPLYFILHFLAVGLDLLLSLFAQGFLFGVRGDYTGAAEFLSPTVYLMNQVEIDHTYVEVFVPDVVHGTLTPDGYGYYTSELTAVTWESVWLIAAYALAGAALLALAYALYSRRRSEAAGDVVAVGWMKPIFRYGVALCGALLGGLVLYVIFWQAFQTAYYYEVIPMAVCMMAAGAIFYYAASMLLAKSLRVFRGSWRGLAVVAAGVAVICCALRFDLLGVERRVPEIDEVDRVVLEIADNTYYFVPGQEDALLEQVRQLHQAIIEDKEYARSLQDAGFYNLDAAERDRYAYAAVEFSYGVSGKEVERRYSLRVNRDRMEEPGTFDYLMDQLVNSTAMRNKRLHAGDSRYTAENGYIYLDVRNEHVSFGNREARAIHEAVALDAAAGNWGEYDWFSWDDGGQYAMDLELEFQYEEDLQDGSRTYYDNIYIRVRPGMTHTVDCLLALDLVEPEDLVTYAELNPGAYPEGDREAYAYGSAPELAETAEIIHHSGSAAASIGVIGGADGPTAIMVN